MTRPRLASVDPDARTMTIEFAGAPPRFVTIPMRSTVLTDGAARTLAQSELDSYADADLALFDAMATPDAERAIAETLRDVYATVRRVQRVHACPPTVLHCPCCCAKITTADSPSLEYIERCSICRRQLVITRDDGGAIVISVELEP